MFCLDVCLNVTFIQMLPNTGDPPQCALNECIQCDEDRSGPVFASVAGRTRRTSGLLSFIVRPCAQLTILDHTDPCSYRPPPTPPPTPWTLPPFTSIPSSPFSTTEQSTSDPSTPTNNPKKKGGKKGEKRRGKK